MVSPTPSDSSSFLANTFNPSLAFSSLISEDSKKSRRKRSRARKFAKKTFPNPQKSFLSEYKPPELKAYAEYVGCWHRPEDEHTIGCVSTVYKVDVRLPLPPVPVLGERLVSESLQPQYVTHSYTFRKDSSKGEPEFVEEYGPLVWTKSSWETYPKGSTGGGSKRLEEPRGRFKGRFADPVKWVKKGKRIRNLPVQGDPESTCPINRKWGKTPQNSRLNSPDTRSWSDWLKSVEPEEQTEPLPLVDSLGRVIENPWPRPDEARAVREDGGCWCKNPTECHHDWHPKYWRGVE